MTELKTVRTSGRLILVLGDQQSLTLSALQGANKAQDLILMAEAVEEARYVPHHKKKIAFLFSAMRHHADLLRRDG
jgi:deoxyribodipyrimidine photolyase-related protein